MFLSSVLSGDVTAMDAERLGSSVYFPEYLLPLDQGFSTRKWEVYISESQNGGKNKYFDSILKTCF